MPIEVSTRVLERPHPSFCPYSLNLIEVEFCELRLERLLGS